MFGSSVITIIIIPDTYWSYSLPEQVLAVTEGPGELNGVRVPVEGFQVLPEELHAAVGVVVGLASLLLQLLPDDEEPVHVGVVQEEDGIVGGVLQRGHGVQVAPSHQVVDVVVGHLVLNLFGKSARSLVKFTVVVLRSVKTLRP